jgi:hypothetical protein
MAELTYRDAVTRAIAQEMEHDQRVYFIGEDVAAAGGVFKTTPGLLEKFGPERVRDTPISEEAITGAIMGAAMTGLRPIAEIMFSDFFATCWDIVANQIAKTRYMTDGQVTLPLVIRSANGGGLRFGAQHSQSVENWAMAIPGLKVVVPSNPRDAIGLFAASVRDDDPVGDAEEPGAERPVLKAFQPAQCLGERLAGGVLGKLFRAEPPVAVAVDRPDIVPVERGEGLSITPGTLDDRRFIPDLIGPGAAVLGCFRSCRFRHAHESRRYSFPALSG